MCSEYREACFRDGQFFWIEVITKIFPEFNFSICYKNHKNKHHESSYLWKILRSEQKSLIG